MKDQSLANLIFFLYTVLISLALNVSICVSLYWKPQYFDSYTKLILILFATRIVLDNIVPLYLQYPDKQALFSMIIVFADELEWIGIDVFVIKVFT